MYEIKESRQHIQLFICKFKLVYANITEIDLNLKRKTSYIKYLNKKYRFRNYIYIIILTKTICPIHP